MPFLVLLCTQQTHGTTITKTMRRSPPTTPHTMAAILASLHCAFTIVDQSVIIKTDIAITMSLYLLGKFTVVGVDVVVLRKRTVHNTASDVFRSRYGISLTVVTLFV